MGANGAKRMTFLLDQVEDAMNDYSPNRINAGLIGQYNEIFSPRSSTLAIETAMHVPAHTDASLTGDDLNLETHRFVFNFEMKSIRLHFTVVHDDDPRTHIDGHRTVRFRDINKSLDGLIECHRQSREIEAARIFNQCGTYDPTIGGDGISLCSQTHPRDGGTWSNAEFNAELTQDRLRAVVQKIESESTDYQAIKIKIRAISLLVPHALACNAEIAVASLDRPVRIVGCDYLVNKNTWFVLTDVARHALVRFERRPFEWKAMLDGENDCVYVKSFERGAFGCSDPRAVYGVTSDSAFKHIHEPSAYVSSTKFPLDVRSPNRA